MKIIRASVALFLQWFYYVAIVEDFILRFGWTLSMSLIEMGYDREVMISILAPLEVNLVLNSAKFKFLIFFLISWQVIRRFVWNFFRLE